MSTSRKVLVIGDDTRSFLATVRSLGRRGLEVHAAPSGLDAPALASRYIARIHLLPYYVDEGEHWLAAMLSLLRQQGYDLVIACDERGLLPLKRHRALLEPFARLAIPDVHSLKTLFDKQFTRELAVKLGIPVPHGRPITATDNAVTLCAEFPPPMALKYRKSYEWPDLYVRRSSCVALSFGDAEDWLQRNMAEPDKLMVEEFVAGRGGGLSVLSDGGKIILAFEHERVRELAGGSYYRRSVALDPQRLQAVASMLEALSYTGLAMFEFRVGLRRDQWWLLEVNARPWGSMPLPLALGVDFPFALYQLMTQGVVAQPVGYRLNVYGRNLIPDLWQLRAELKAAGTRRRESAGKMLGWLGTLSRGLTAREHHDVWVRDDPRPAWLEFKQFLAEIGNGLRLVQALRQRHDAVEQRRKAQALLRAAGVRPHLLFLCQGNICRSPYAEHRLASSLAPGVPTKVDSAGMLPRNSRPSPPVAVAAAARRGVDLTAHRSRHAHAEVLASATLILAFDEVDIQSLARRYPALRERVILLGAYMGGDIAVPVRDPDGATSAVFDATYEQIDRCIAALARDIPTGI